MTATSGRRCYESYERFIPDWSLRRMCQALMTQPIWSSTQLRLTWKGSVTQRSRLKFRLVPLVPRTGGKECGLWQTPSVEDASRQGSKEAWEQWQDRGRTTQCRLRNQIHANPPTKNESQMVAADASGSSVLVRGMWPTPSSASQTGGHAGLAGGQGNRQKLYKMLGETEGKKMGSQQLNPNWVEWLMGFPLGWTALEPSETPSSRKSRKR